MTGRPLPELDEVESAHLVGIGGAAMTPLATILLQKGVRVSGSDLVEASSLDRLRALGAEVKLGHRAEHVGDVDVVVASSAVPPDNPELEAARSRGLPVVKHSAALGSLMRRRRGIAVAGTHGKTTTAALIAVVLKTAGLEPTFHVGSELLNYGLFGEYGRSDLLVAEADEYDRRFLDYEPEVAVVTSVEADHLDYFGDFRQVVDAFQAFVAQVRPGGATVVCADDSIARGLKTEKARRVTYGWSSDADYQVVQWEALTRGRSEVAVRWPDGRGSAFELGLLGPHNAANAAATIAVCAHLGVDRESIIAGLQAFRGTRRRFEVVGAVAGITLVDDYAHHPTAIRVTLAAARAHFSSPIRVIFQPHTVHRTISLFDDFAGCFSEADQVILVPTYRPPGREANEDDPTIARLAAAMDHPDARWMPAAQAAEAVAAAAQPGDLLLVMGAGDVCEIEPQILGRLRERRG